MNKYEQYKIKIGDENKALISEYLEGVNKYIKKNNLDNELYLDIEERIFEKLSTAKKLNQLYIMQIINEIGEPEDIFDIEDIAKKDNNLDDILKNTKGGLKKVKTIFPKGTSILVFISFLKEILMKGYNYIKGNLINLYNMNIIKKILFVISSIIGYLLLLVSITMFMVFPLLYSGIEIGTINYSSLISFELILSYSFLVFFLLSISIYFIRRKISLFKFIVSSILLVLSISFSILGIMNGYKNYTYEGEIIQEYSIDSNSLESISHGNFAIYDKFDISQEIFNNYSVLIEPSIDDKVGVKIINKVYTKDEESFENIGLKLNDYDVGIQNKKLFIILKDGKAFKELSNFVLSEKAIIIYIPKNIKVNISHFENSNVWLKGLYDCVRKNDMYTSHIENIDGNITCEKKTNDIGGE